MPGSPSSEAHAGVEAGLWVGLCPEEHLSEEQQRWLRAEAGGDPLSGCSRVALIKRWELQGVGWKAPSYFQQRGPWELGWPLRMSIHFEHTDLRRWLAISSSGQQLGQGQAANRRIDLHSYQEENQTT